MKILLIVNTLLLICMLLSLISLPKLIGREINSIDLISLKQIFAGFIAALLSFVYIIIGILLFIHSYTLIQ